MRRALFKSRNQQKAIINKKIMKKEIYQMFYAKDFRGIDVPITNTNVFTRCPKCGVEHKIDLVSTIVEHGEDCTGDILDSTMFCEKCSKAHLPLWEHMGEIEFVASRFPGVSAGRVTNVVRKGLDHGLSFDTALAGARLALAEEAGQGSLYTLDEVASVLGCTTKVAGEKMEQLGISPIQVSALPGFEWLLGQK